MRVLAVIPARGGSKRVPRKNLERIGDRTLVRRALETAVSAGCFEQVALSSDDAETLAEAEGLPVAALERPAELATDEARSLDVALDALRRLEVDTRFDAVAIVQCTSPFTAPEDLAGAVQLLTASGAASVVSVVRITPGEHPLKLKTLDAEGRLHPYLAEDSLTRSQDLPPLWRRNGSIYVSRRSVLEQGRLLDENDLRGFEMPPERSFDIDDALDLAFARFLASDGLDAPRR